MKLSYEAAEEYRADAYRVEGWSGIAWRVLGWETKTTEDSGWDGVEERTGKLVVVMVGDDRHFAVDPREVTALEREDYCGGCGQIGCGFG